MDRARKVSPMSYVRTMLPAVLAIHSQGDPVVPYGQSQRLVQALKTEKDDAELITLPGDQHGLDAAGLENLWPQIFKWLKKRKLVD